ncbi:MAG TPA: hypothetical protein VM755_09930 [Stellaceae bacterium]|nr:hypothetical protein [Stellaceae bacterium]
MIFTETPVEGAYLIDLEKRGDERGFFARAFCGRDFAAQRLETFAGLKPVRVKVAPRRVFRTRAFPIVDSGTIALNS